MVRAGPHGAPAPAPPWPDSRRRRVAGPPPCAARGAPYLCGRARTRPWRDPQRRRPRCAEAAPLLGGRRADKEARQPLAGRRAGPGRAGRAARGGAGRGGSGAGRLSSWRPAGGSPSRPGSPRAVARARRARVRQVAATATQAASDAAAAASCALWERGRRLRSGCCHRGGFGFSRAHAASQRLRVPSIICLPAGVAAASSRAAEPRSPPQDTRCSHPSRGRVASLDAPDPKQSPEGAE